MVKKCMALLLILAAVALYAQEGSAGLTFSGGIATGLWYQGGDNTASVFKIANDEALITDTRVTFGGHLNRGTYGLDFVVTYDAALEGGYGQEFHVNTANVWANFFDNKLGFKVGRVSGFSYGTSVLAFWGALAQPVGRDGILVEIKPMPGLEIGIVSSFLVGGPPPFSAPGAEDFARSIDFGIKYSNSSFSIVAGLDQEREIAPPPLAGHFSRLYPHRS